MLLPDLAAENANRWPAFAAAALAAGVHAEFSLPLTVGPGGIGTFDLCRDRPGMLSDEHLADALVALPVPTRTTFVDTTLAVILSEHDDDQRIAAMADTVAREITRWG